MPTIMYVRRVEKSCKTNSSRGIMSWGRIELRPFLIPVPEDVISLNLINNVNLIDCALRRNLILSLLYLPNLANSKLYINS